MSGLTIHDTEAMEIYRDLDEVLITVTFASGVLDVTAGRYDLSEFDRIQSDRAYDAIDMLLTVHKQRFLADGATEQSLGRLECRKGADRRRGPLREQIKVLIELRNRYLVAATTIPGGEAPTS